MIDQLLASLSSGARNQHTTISGMTVAVCSYIAQVGPALPVTRAQWWQFIASLAIVALGVVAKDARTGSQPPSTTLTLPPLPPRSAGQ